MFYIFHKKIFYLNKDYLCVLQDNTISYFKVLCLIQCVTCRSSIVCEIYCYFWVKNSNVLVRFMLKGKVCYFYISSTNKSANSDQMHILSLSENTINYALSGLFIEF